MKSEITLRKPNATLVMTAKAGKLTAIERKLFNAILLSSRQQLIAHRELHGQDPSNKHFYCAPADELLDTIEVGKSNLKSSLRKHISALRHTEVVWEAPDAKTGPVWDDLTILSQGKCEIRNGRLFVLWALPPGINIALSDSQDFPFTKLDLEKVALLTSYTAVALYEICARYRNNYLKGGDGECLTSKNSPEWWVDVLTNIIPKKDKETGHLVRREWRKVKNEAVKKAIDEINGLTDLSVELKEEKEGKAVSLVQFIVRQKKAQPREIQSSHFELLKTGVRLGLTEAQIESAIARTSVEQVGLGLGKLEGRINSQDLEPIENVGRYFSTMINQSAPLKVVSDIETARKHAPPITDTQAIQEKSVQTLAKEKFMAIPESEKKELAVRAFEELSARGIASLRMQRNAEEGVWSGPLLSQMIEIFRR